MFPLISILIANYNNGHFFIDAYNSLINQTEKNWEAIIIDDCSTDNSVEIIQDLIKDDYRFKLYKNPKNLGYQKTIVKAISLSTSEIFARLDPDDALSNNAIEVSVATHQNYPKAGLVYSNFTVCNDKLEKIKIHKTKQINKQDESYYGFKGEISHFASFKKSIYNLTEGIDIFNKRAEDQDIYMKMCEVAPVRHVDKDLYLYRIHDNGISTNNNSDKAYFWHWVALIKMSERRNINLEDLFLEKFERREKVEEHQKLRTLLKKSRWLKLGYKLGLFKLYKYL